MRQRKILTWYPRGSDVHSLSQAARRRGRQRSSIEHFSAGWDASFRDLTSPGGCA